MVHSHSLDGLWIAFIIEITIGHKGPAVIPFIATVSFMFIIKNLLVYDIHAVWLVTRNTRTFKNNAVLHLQLAWQLLSIWRLLQHVVCKCGVFLFLAWTKYKFFGDYVCGEFYFKWGNASKKFRCAEEITNVLLYYDTFMHVC